MLQMYKVETSSRQKYGFRKVTFAEANDFGGRDIFRLLEYMTLILRIFTLEYLMGRNNTPGRQIIGIPPRAPRSAAHDSYQ